MKNYLPHEHYKHWLLLVNAMRILFRKHVPVDKKHKAVILIHSFVVQVPKLYGVHSASYNIHLLLHVSEYLDHWGAPWGYSGFMYEHLGGLLLKLFHGTTDVSKQILSNFQAVLSLRAYASKHIPSADESVKSLYKDFGFDEHQDNCNVETLGKGQFCSLDYEETQLIEKLICGTLTCRSAISHNRLRIRGQLFSTVSYDQPYSRCNSIVCTKAGSYCEIEKVIVFRPNCVCRLEGSCNLGHDYRSKCIPLPECNIVVLAKSFAIKHDSIVDDSSGIDLTKFMPFIDKSVSTERVALKPTDIGWKCVRINNESAEYLIVNDLQFERG